MLGNPASDIFLFIPSVCSRLQKYPIYRIYVLMSDPVSLAGTAVGVVSLGLILCQGLTDYLQALECRKEDIESTSRQVDCLRSALNVINVALPNLPSDHQNAGHVVEECLHLCEEEIKRLSDKLNELKDQSHSDSFNQKLRLQAQKLAYPFKRGSLRRLEDSVVKINRILSTALQAIGLFVTLDFYSFIYPYQWHVSAEICG